MVKSPLDQLQAVRGRRRGLWKVLDSAEIQLKAQHTVVQWFMRLIILPMCSFTWAARLQNMRSFIGIRSAMKVPSTTQHPADELSEVLMLLVGLDWVANKPW